MFDVYKFQFSVKISILSFISYVLYLFPWAY